MANDPTRQQQETLEYFRRAAEAWRTSAAVRWLRPGGTLVLGSRNRLFNVFSLNQFTRLESERGTVPALLAEATAIAEADSSEEMLARLVERSTELPVVEAHPRAGVTGGALA